MGGGGVGGTGAAAATTVQVTFQKTTEEFADVGVPTVLHSGLSLLAAVPFAPGTIPSGWRHGGRPTCRLRKSVVTHTHNHQIPILS